MENTQIRTVGEMVDIFKDTTKQSGLSKDDKTSLTQFIDEFIAGTSTLEDFILSTMEFLKTLRLHKQLHPSAKPLLSLLMIIKDMYSGNPDTKISEGDKVEVVVKESVPTSSSKAIRKVDSVIKYDVIRTNLINQGGQSCPHYAVVYKVEDGMVYCIAITSKELYGKILIEKSRIFNGGYFVPTFSIIPMVEAVKVFSFVYDVKKEFDKAVEKVLDVINR